MYAVINLYNDCQFLAACLEGIKQYVSGIVVADGAYELYFREYKKLFPRAEPFSTDGSLEIIKALDLPPWRIITNNREPWLNQTVKRNALIDAVPDGEWFLIIDADEGLLGHIEAAFREIEESGCVVAQMPFVNLGADLDRMQYFWHPRVFLKTRGMRYDQTHWQLYDWAGRIIENTYPIWWTQTCVMVHFKLLKAQNRLEPHQRYMDKLGYRGWAEPDREVLERKEF